jgi:hypothetical protein
MRSVHLRHEQLGFGSTDFNRRVVQVGVRELVRDLNYF